MERQAPPRLVGNPGLAEAVLGAPFHPARRTEFMETPWGRGPGWAA